MDSPLFNANNPPEHWDIQALIDAHDALTSEVEAHESIGTQSQAQVAAYYVARAKLEVIHCVLYEVKA